MGKSYCYRIKAILGKNPTLTIIHDKDFYNGAEWANHLLGMQGYFSRFPETHRKPGIIQTLGNLGFILGTSADPEIDLDLNDERSRFILAIAKHLDGLIFSPSALRDAEGRVLLACDGTSDPDAGMSMQARNSVIRQTATSGGIAQLRDFYSCGTLAFAPAFSRRQRH